MIDTAKKHTIMCSSDAIGICMLKGIYTRQNQDHDKAIRTFDWDTYTLSIEHPSTRAIGDSGKPEEGSGEKHEHTLLVMKYRGEVLGMSEWSTLSNSTKTISKNDWDSTLEKYK